MSAKPKCDPSMLENTVALWGYDSGNSLTLSDAIMICMSLYFNYSFSSMYVMLF